MLRHSTDSKPGITRERKGTGWAYFDADGKRITDRDEIDRLNAIALPPATMLPRLKKWKNSCMKPGM